MKKQEIKPGQGKRLKDCIKYANTTQEKLADLIFTTPQTISKIANEKSPLSLDNAVRISRALKVRLEYLLLEDDYMTETEKIHEYTKQDLGRKNSCQSLIESLGYTVITMKENPDGSSESMHRPFKRLTINDNDSSEQIIQRAESSYPVRIFVLKAPDGRSVYVEQEEYMRIIQDIEDYAIMKCEKPFHRFERARQIIRNGGKKNGSHRED